MANGRIGRQVQRVLEEGSGQFRSVIVQMASPEEDREALVADASVALRGRTLALTARDCLPAQRPGAESQTLAMPRPRRTAADPDAAGSLSTKLKAALHPSKSGAAAARDQAVGHLRPLLENKRVQVAINRASEQGAVDTSMSLWAAGSVALEMSPEDLERLAQEVEGIEGIYPNRKLFVPPVQEARNLPEAVLEARASSWGLERIGALATWGAYLARGAGSKIAVLDTGVDPSHPDLEEKIVDFAEFDPHGQQVPNAEAHDADRHGTHVCGTIVGGNASGQWIGVAPDAKLVVGKVLGAAGGSDAQVLAGITWAIEQGVDAINMSLGGLVLDAEAPPVYTNALVSSLQAGIPVVAAIGNEGAQTTGSPGNDLFAFSVGATDHLDRPAGFSGGRTQLVRESDYIDPGLLPMPYSKPELSAPGVGVVSCVPGGGWAALNGTSMAAPHVAGALALLFSATTIRDLDARERAFVAQDLLVGSVDEFGESGPDHRFGFGRVNALRMIGFARERGL